MSFITEIKNEIQKSTDGGEERTDRSFVASAFITRARGGIKFGGAAGYHIEFVFDDIDRARELCEILASYEVFPKLIQQDGSIRVYLKHSDDICNLLALMGVNNCLLRLSDEIALRNVRNTANRRANCDTANIEKQVEAARIQVEKINEIKKSDNWGLLDTRLRETAEARLNNPEATYDELAHLLGITKSGVVHRLKKILKQMD